MKKGLTIIIPTYNNPEFLTPCVNSIIRTNVLSGPTELLIVNNGKQPIKEQFSRYENIRVLDSGRNLGWEGGLQYGLENSDSEFVCFQNDDTLLIRANKTFYEQLLWPFHNTNVAAVGPATTVASGWHSVLMPAPVQTLIEVPYLIFFTVMMRRSDLMAAGGIDTSAPGGDDFDLSIRLRKMGKKLLINPDAFLIHHGFKTGERVRGNREVSGGWNSKDMIDRTNKWLIQKHGFKAYMETMRGFDYNIEPSVDREAISIIPHIVGDKVVELGCGGRKTVPNAIGVDIIPTGETPSYLNGHKCVADINADVTKRLPIDDLSCDTVIARHILEHCVDTIGTLRNWNRILKIGGRLIIAVPNHSAMNTIPLNPEHCHGFSPESLKNILEVCGFKQSLIVDPQNGISFIAVCEKVLHPESLINGKVLETVNA